MSLARSAAQGAAWQISCGGAQAIVRLVSSMVLARNLDPVDFGIFGMAHIIYGFFEVTSATGMTSGLIAKRDSEKIDYATCFWSIISIRIMVFVLVLFCSQLLAGFFNAEHISKAIEAVCFLLIICGIGSVPQAILSKKLQFKKIAIIRLMSLLLESLLAIFLVLNTNLKYWALIIAMIISIGVMNILLLIWSRWLPSFEFSKESFVYLFRYGVNNTGSAMTIYLASNFDYLLVGKLLGTKMLGFYEYAYRIPHLITEKVAGPVGLVFFPSIASLGEDNNKIAQGFLSASKYLAWVVFPVFAGLIVMSPYIVVVLWGEKWSPIVVPMQILCLSAALSSVLDLSRAIFLCKNRPDIPLKFDIISFIVCIVTVSLFGYLYGLKGVAWGMVFAKLTTVLSNALALKMVDCRLVDMLKNLWKPLVSSLVMMGFVHFFMTLRMSLVEIQLPIGILVGVFSYGLIVKVFFKTEFEDIKLRIRESI